ncbi:hypothetical protein LEP1GSC041_3363 [Leptospira noguchii str. 2006001870]|nr:hypothetical protein LEP1GSC041_3363 [Leptospira noguchii str. 2006001870]
MLPLAWILTSEDMVGHPSAVPNLLDTLELLPKILSLNQSKCTILSDSKPLPHTFSGPL